MKVQTIIRSKWLVKFHPSIEADDADWDHIRWACRHLIWKKPHWTNGYDLRNILEGHIRDRINS
jgi:hypothetical protein